MGLRPSQGSQRLLGTASTLYGTVTLSLSSRPERTQISLLAALATTTPVSFSFSRRLISPWRLVRSLER
jgi:hypothetical protein